MGIGSPSKAALTDADLTAPRILFFSRWFWPLSAGRHERAAEAVRLARLWHRGYQVEVVTPRYASSWPEQIVFDELLVHRFATAPKGHWSTSRHIRLVGTWTQQWIGNQTADQPMVLVTSGINEDCLALASVLDHSRSRSAREQGRLQLIALCDGWGYDADEIGSQFGRNGQRQLQSLRHFDHVVTRHAGADRKLIAGGVPSAKLARIPRGFARPEKIDQHRREQARKSLQKINTDLATGTEDRVLLWCGHMTGRPRGDSGVGRVVGSARLLCTRYPNLKIWLIGDGELHDWVHTELKAEGVRSVVAIPGSFTELIDLYHAADFVAITDEEQLRFAMPSALTAGHPMLIRDTPAIRAYFNERLSRNAVDSLAWYDHARESSFRKVFRSLWDDFENCHSHAQEIAAYLASDYGERSEYEAWREIFVK